MKSKIITYKLIIMLLMLWNFQTLSAQDYRVDSLQIKVYTEIEYQAGQPKDISIRKVFCDYCSENQLQVLGEDAIRRAENEKNDNKSQLKDGKRKIAVYIRIAKADFAKIE